MANKKGKARPARPSASPRLTVSRAEAESMIAAQIDEGNLLQRRSVETDEQFEQLRARCEQWDDFNMLMLRKLFDSPGVSKRYGLAYGDSMIGMILPFRDELPYLLTHTKLATQYLESVERQLPLYEQLTSVPVPDKGPASGKQPEKATGRSPVPFISMSFEERDQDINDYVKSILDALQIPYVTGERYSKESIPEKVRARILESDFLIAIFVRRGAMKDGAYTPPSWLVKEVTIAQEAGKSVVAWVEKGVTDIAGLNLEKELIYFERDDVKAIQKATTKFLEALKEHMPGAIAGEVQTGPDAKAREDLGTVHPPRQGEEELDALGSGPAMATGEGGHKRASETPANHVTKIVYYDPDYPASWVKAENATQARDYFVKRSFIEKNAEELREWIGEALQAGLTYRSILVFAQDIAPDTVAEVRNETCLLRKYLDAGGRVVWRGDIPFWYQGKPREAVDEWLGPGPLDTGPWKILGVCYYNYRFRWNTPKSGEGLIWAGGVPSEITPAGRDIGLRYPSKRIIMRPVPCEDVHMTYLLVPQRGFSIPDANAHGAGGDFALCWKKNFNEQYPHGGFMQYVPGNFIWREVNADFFRFAVSGWPVLFDE